MTPSRLLLTLFARQNIAQPSGFEWVGAPSIYRQGRTYRSNFDIDAHRPAYAVTYYIDPVSGSDVNDGLTELTPRANLSTTVTLANTGAVPARFLCKPGAYYGTQGWSGAVPTVDFIIEPWASNPTDPANRLWFVRPASMTADQWFLEAGSQYRWGGTFATDPSYVFDRTGLSGGLPHKYVAAADKATCAATPGSYWRDGATNRIYVRTFDSRSLTGAGDKGIVVITTGGGNNFRFACTASVTMWVQNVCFIDGSNNIYVQSGATDLTVNVYMKDCQTVGGIIANGTAFISTHANTVINVYQKRCGAGYNGFDGFNYRSDTGAGALVRYFEDECFTAYNGSGVGGANNASTAHGVAIGITMNCNFAGSQNRVINDIDSSRRWMLGSTVAASAASDATAITVQAGSGTGSHTAQIWMDGCTLANSATAAVYSETGCAVRYTRMHLSGLTTGGAGTIAAY
jgi:hypothetical protein